MLISSIILLKTALDALPLLSTVRNLSAVLYIVCSTQRTPLDITLLSNYLGPQGFEVRTS